MYVIITLNVVIPVQPTGRISYKLIFANLSKIPQGSVDTLVIISPEGKLMYAQCKNHMHVD